MTDLFSELFGMFDGMNVFSASQPIQRDNRVCPVCSYTTADFNKTGKFGCSECYNVFANEAGAVMRQIHSSSKHVGKIPSKSSADIKAKRKLEDLRKRLKTAVADENYEEAARLHAKIKELEGGVGK